jgi:hypothetical protein
MQERELRALRKDNARLSNECQRLSVLNAEIMKQSMATLSCMVWLFGEDEKKLLRKTGQKTLTIPKKVILEEAPLLKIATDNTKDGGKKFFVRKMTEEEVEEIRKERLAKLEAAEDSGPKIIVP